MRIRLEIAYLGTRFEGWQVQDPEREGTPPRTVQGELETVLTAVYGAALRVHGAGRTDAGVHAEMQVAHFDVPEGGPRIPPHGLLRAVDGRLPEDVRVTAVIEAAPEWHARFSAREKVYVYRLRRGDFLHPHRGLVEALAREELNVPRMRDAAARLVGKRDFAPFSVGVGERERDTVRTLRRLDVDEDGSLIVVTAVGDGFLRGMVRRLVGTLREVGRGRTRPEDALAHPGQTAEPRGLTLDRVLY